MPVLQQFTDSRVVMHARDHQPPHVHVQLNDGRQCMVELGRLVLIGRVKLREIRHVLVWIEHNRIWLYLEWQKLNP